MRQKDTHTKKRSLELCCGYASFSHVCKSEFDFDECVTVDNSDHFNPTHCIDVRNVDFLKQRYPVDFFDIIWASPPCQLYSNCRKTATTPANLERDADPIVLACLHLIQHFRPRLWYLENPFTGQMRHRRFMRGLYNVRVDYCSYGLNMQKKTVIFTNDTCFVPKQCAGIRNCHAMIGRKHIGTLTGRYSWKGRWSSKKEKARDTARIPMQLVREILCGVKQKEQEEDSHV